MHTHRSVMYTTPPAAGGTANQACRAGGAAAVPRDRHAEQHERPDLRRRHRGAAAALGPRRRGAVRRSAIASPAGADHRHGGRLPLASRSCDQYDLSSLRRIGGGGARDARGGGAGDAQEVRPQLHRGLRPVGDDGRHAHRTRPSARRSSAWASRSSTSTRASSIPSRCTSCRRARSARSSCTARRCFGATGTSPRPPPRRFVEIDGKRFLRTGDLGASTTTATSSSSIASSA